MLLLEWTPWVDYRMESCIGYWGCLPWVSWLCFYPSCTSVSMCDWLSSSRRGCGSYAALWTGKEKKPNSFSTFSWVSIYLSRCCWIAHHSHLIKKKIIMPDLQRQKDFSIQSQFEICNLTLSQSTPNPGVHHSGKAFFFWLVYQVQFPAMLGNN